MSSAVVHRFAWSRSFSIRNSLVTPIALPIAGQPFARRQPVAGLDELADPPMEDREEDRLRRGLEESIEPAERGLGAPFADGVGERPDRRRDGLGDERADVVGLDRGVAAVQGELVELHRRDPRLVGAFRIGLADEPADAFGQRLGGARAENEPALARLGFDPAGEGALARRLEAADRAAGRGDRIGRAAWARAPSPPSRSRRG